MKHRDLSPELNLLTEQIIGCAIEVHRALGPGLLERLYEQALLHELALQGLDATAQHPISVEYKGVRLGGDQRIDLLIADRVVVELKAVERVSDVHLAQLVSYLCAGHFPVGLLINFHVPVLRSGVYRRVNSRVIQPLAMPSATSASPSAPPRSP